ncbi:hypothetical protein HY485_00425 [Candidatus Woesearchaeota archaeon]|nr:hypothetical protein [Candidatus Woesearchaeota archaeon]
MDPTTTLPSKTREIKIMTILFALSAVLLKIVFYNETIATVASTTAAFFWLFIIPGYFVTLIWKQDSTLTERFIISIPVSAAILGITSYYLGLFGLPLKIQAWILPPIIILISIFCLKVKKVSQKT